MPSFATAEVIETLREHGEEMKLRRQVTSSPQTWTDVTLMGKRYAPKGAQADDLAGAAKQALIRVIISNAEIAAGGWPGPPRQGDRLMIDGRAYTLQADADTRKDAGDTVAHFLVVKGGPG